MASAAAPRSFATSRPGTLASDDSAGRRSTRRCWHLAPTPIATRWASPTTCFARSSASGSPPEQQRRCDPLPDPEDRIDPATRRRGIDNFASFMKFLAPAGRGDDRPAGRAGGAGLCRASGARRVMCRADDRPEPRARLRPQGRCRCSQICCCTISAPATTSRRRRRSPRRFARRRCGAALSAAACCTMAARPRSRMAIVRHGGEAETVRAAVRCRRHRAAREPRCSPSLNALAG